jgi:hypothetical protein
VAVTGHEPSLRYDLVVRVPAGGLVVAGLLPATAAPVSDEVIGIYVTSADVSGTYTTSADVIGVYVVSDDDLVGWF